jgi:hypothetical protein
MKNQLNKLHEEDKKTDLFVENYKKQLSEEIKKFKPTDIKNSLTVEKKYTVWQRLLKTLGIT